MSQVNTAVFDGRAVIGERQEQQAYIDDISPVDGSLIARISDCTDREVDQAVALARSTFESGVWSRISADDRRKALLRLAELLEENAAALAELETRDMGKPIAQSLAVDIPGAAATFRWYAELADKTHDEIPVTPPGSTALVTREPLGVIAAITPWNYPLEIAAWKLAPALMLGNSVVLKPATQSSLTALRLADFAQQAGIPAGVLNVVTGRGSVVGDRLARHRDVDALTFTGSTQVAKSLQVAAGQSNMKRLCLEAGGKSANLIFADTAELRVAAAKAAFGAFYNQGEVCSANSRILVERSVFEPFVQLLIEEAGAYAVGDPLDPENAGAGALVDEAHADTVQGFIGRAAEEGVVRCGGKRLSFHGSTAYIQPTVITGLPEDHELHRVEVFGPVVTVQAFDSEDEAIALANETEFGLAASVFTADLARAHRVSQRLVAGTVSVNTVDALGLTTPFGGFKQSGFGKDLSVHALDNYSALKTTWIQFG